MKIVLVPYTRLPDIGEEIGASTQLGSAEEALIDWCNEYFYEEVSYTYVPGHCRYEFSNHLDAIVFKFRWG